MIHSQPLEITTPKSAHHRLRLASLQPQPAKAYRYDIKTTLKHSNATQNIYFSNYFEWQGTVREQWFFECIAKDMLQSEGVFITKQAHNNFLKEAFPFQTITCTLNTFNIQRCSFYLLFKFYCMDELISVGYQQIVFANHAKKITKLRPDIISKIQRYESQADDFLKTV